MQPDKIKPEHNPWYLLATLHGEAKSSNDEVHARNRMTWNRFMAAELTEQARELLIKEGRCSAEELKPFTAEELSEVGRFFAERQREATCGDSTTGTTLRLPNLKRDRIDFSNIKFHYSFLAKGFLFPMQRKVDFGLHFGFTGPPSGLADFRGAIVSDTADFSGATFLGRVDFRGATIRRADFKGVIFNHRTLSKPGDWADFSGTTFFDTASFLGATFFGRADFRRATFGQPDFVGVRTADFRATTFKSEVIFSNATFSGAVEFMGATFSDRADFSGATTFSDSANFSGVTFSGRADFSGVRFSGETDFSGAITSGEAAFLREVYSVHVGSSGAFEKEAVFVNAKMEGPTTFEDATFSTAPPRFFEAKLHQGTVWRGVPPWPLPAHPEEAGQFVDAYACLKLEMDRLKKHEDELDFFALELQSRRVLLGESEQQVSELRVFGCPVFLVPPFKIILEKIKTLRLRELFGRFSAQPLFARQARTIRVPRSLHGFAIALYGWLSDYGRSYVRPLCWLLVTFLVGVPPFWWHLSRFWQATGLSLANTFGVFGFRRELVSAEVLTCLPGLLKAVAAAQTVAGIVLLFLVGLAIRNRFRMK